MLLSKLGFAILFIAFFSANCKEDDDEILSNNPLAHGYGDDIDWVPWDEALDLAKEQNKPIFLLIHKSWCHACIALKKKFQQISALKELKAASQHFIMVNTEDDEEPWEEKYQPDGKYIPRLLFLDPEGEVMTDIRNEKSEFANYKYYYISPGQIFDTMKKIAKKFGFVKDDKKAPKKTEGKLEGPSGDTKLAGPPMDAADTKQDDAKNDSKAEEAAKSDKVEEPKSAKQDDVKVDKKEEL